MVALFRGISAKLRQSERLLLIGIASSIFPELLNREGTIEVGLRKQRGTPRSRSP
jgi:hypothetical protein